MPTTPMSALGLPFGLIAICSPCPPAFAFLASKTKRSAACGGYGCGMRAVISATDFSPARRTMAWASASLGQRSHRRRVSSRNTSSRVRSGNIVLLRSTGRIGPNTTKGRWHPTSPSGSQLGRFAAFSGALIRRFGWVPAGAPSLSSRRLFGSLLGRDDRDEGSAGFGAESYAAVRRGEEGVVLPHADVHARMEFRAALAHDDVAGEHLLIAEFLDAETTAGRVAPVARRAACFLV